MIDRMNLSRKDALSNFVNASEYVKIYFPWKHGDSHDIDSEQGSLTTLIRLRDVENTVFDLISLRDVENTVFDF